MVFASRRAVRRSASRAVFGEAPAYRMRMRAGTLRLAVVAVCACVAAASSWPAHAVDASSNVSAPPAVTAAAPTAPAAPAAPTAPTAPSAPKAELAASGASAPSNAGSAPPPAPVTARTPAPTPGPAPAPATFAPSQQLRYGGYAVFRNMIPSSMLEAQSAEEFDQIARGAEHMNRLYPATDARVKRVQSIVDKLIPYSLKWNDRAKNWKWDIAVLRSADIRAYCLPGGKIVVYGGMLDKVRPNDNELGMLLGHEIAHALREHARERLGEQQAAQLGSGTIPQLFGLADLGEAPLGIGTQLLEMKYERADETEADVMGSEIASRAGFDPRAAITLWDKLATATRNNRDQGFIYVHPYNAARRADIMKRLPDMLPLYAKAIGKTVDALPDYAGIGRPRRTTASD
ncbi:M48 family metallopeptidase [Paraburkholderia sp. LEh10]|uniref:M48 family metallopeptidase n=1 Tax=Paraburkholderia sp. LEh10 TaxID=2821353 RepID=UPI001AE6EE3C|nr:M48 family metallopeptidase [Paraburkholderia sp. LEh10]MBP0592823.1 M48 family metallopeptidase [Paraburkholderia sp. LEh10]